jgi:hypothetical protein
VPGGATLVMVAADPSGTVRWALCLHESAGASLVLPWDGQLLVGVGPTVRVLDETGIVLARRTFDDELLSAWRTTSGLLTFTRHGAQLVNAQLMDLWTAPIEADGFQPLDLTGHRYRIAAMRSDEWDEVLVDARTGAVEVRR